MNVSLSPDLQQFIRDRIDAGQFADESEVIRSALEVLRDQERLTSADVAELRELVNPALAELDRGEGVEWNADELKRQVREDLKRRGNHR